MINPYAEYRTSLFLLPVIFMLVGFIYWVKEISKIETKYFLYGIAIYFTLFFHLNNINWKHPNRPWILSYQEYPRSNIANQEMARFYVTYLDFKNGYKHLEAAFRSGRIIPFHNMRALTGLAYLYFAQGKHYMVVKVGRKVLKGLYYWDYEFFHQYLISLYIENETKDFDRIIKILKEFRDDVFVSIIEEEVANINSRKHGSSKELPIINILRQKDFSIQGLEQRTKQLDKINH
jgi:hypothetical protein